MGQMSEDVIDGTCCAICTSYFVDKQKNLFSHGEPVVCVSCWERLSPEDKNIHKKTNKKTL